MIWYHGTNKEGLEETEKQGYLLHKRGEDMSPVTYLATDIDEARMYGDVVLEVEYDPFIHPKENNYNKDSWQMRVYEPIYTWKIIELKSPTEA
jgi:hypothetical protein